MKNRIPALLLTLSAAVAAGEKVGYLRIENPAGISHLWYPTVSNEEPRSRRYLPLPASQPIRVVEGADPSAGPRPLILLSHGILGLATSYSWLAFRLAESGAVVLSAEHKDQSRSDLEDAELFRFYKRPVTLSAQLDWILGDARFAGLIDRERIFVIGHSVGGHSALLLAGGRFNPDAVLAGARAGAIRNRLAGRMLRVSEDQAPSREDLAANRLSYRDGRLKRAVLLDPVPVHPGFTDSSLKEIGIPILYVGCSKSEIFDSDKVKEALAGLIPGFQSKETGAGHFVFTEEGTWLGRLVRPSIFKDPEGIERSQVHDLIYSWISSFLDLDRTAQKVDGSIP